LPLALYIGTSTEATNVMISAVKSVSLTNQRINQNFQV